MDLMKSLNELPAHQIKVLFTDIDGTMTEGSQIPAKVYDRLERLQQKGIHVVPVTGRPAGWCELIARVWPVHGVVGENGAFYFRFDGKKMRRVFARAKKNRLEDRKKLNVIKHEVLSKVPGAAVASDQFCRLFDLAIDFAEDVQPLEKSAIKTIVDIFIRHGAQAKVSNIHVNGWFGHHNKVSTCKTYIEREFAMSPEAMLSQCVFVGDSPNDEPSFEFFNNSVAVANIREFLEDLKHHPQFITKGHEAQGFVELCDQLLGL